MNGEKATREGWKDRDQIDDGRGNERGRLSPKERESGIWHEICGCDAGLLTSLLTTNWWACCTEGLMKIAQVAPLYESVPPHRYGGTERVVSFLTEELVSQGHEVTLFASGDSRTRANLVAGCPRALRLDEGCVDKLSHH